MLCVVTPVGRQQLRLLHVPLQQSSSTVQPVRGRLQHVPDRQLRFTQQSSSVAQSAPVAAQTWQVESMHFVSMPLSQQHGSVA